MVETATSLGRSGLQDWLIQRVTAVILAIYTIFIFSYLIANSEYNYDNWRALFAAPWMQYASLLALLSLMAHAWIGVWTVITDYIKPTVVRLLMQGLVGFGLFVYLIWGIKIIWGI